MSPRAQRGGALAIVLVLASALLLTVGILATSLGLYQRAAARRGGEVMAFALAEAGIEKGIAEVRRWPGYNGEDLVLVGGRATVRVERETGGILFVTSEGEARGFRRAIRVRGWTDPARDRFLIMDWQESRAGPESPGGEGRSPRAGG